MMILVLLLFFQLVQPREEGTLVVTHPDQDATVIVGDFKRLIHSGDTLRLPDAEFQLRFVFPSHRDMLVTVHIRPDSLTRLDLRPVPIRAERDRALHSMYPVLAYQANLVVETDSGSRLYLNGEPLDATATALQLVPGRYQLKSVDADGRQRRKDLAVTSNRLTYVDFHAPQWKSRLARSSWVPGLAQYHRNEVVKSVLFSTGISALAVTTIAQHTRYDRALGRYRSTRTAYVGVNIPEDLILLAERGKRHADASNQALLHRNISMTAFGLAYAWNLWDGRRPGRSGYREGTPSFRPFIHPDEAGIRIRW